MAVSESGFFRGCGMEVVTEDGEGDGFFLPLTGMTFRRKLWMADAAVSDWRQFLLLYALFDSFLGGV